MAGSSYLKNRSAASLLLRPGGGAYLRRRNESVETAMVRQEQSERRLAEEARDTRLMRRELAEALSVLVVPALLFSTLGLFFP
jgi:hypothetical protein